MSTEWLVPVGLIVLVILTPDTTLTWVFAVLGLVMLAYFMAKAKRTNEMAVNEAVTREDVS